MSLILSCLMVLRVVELDNEYDVDSALDTSENLYRVSMMCLGVFGSLTEDVQTNLWSSLWRALRYSRILVLFDRLLAEMDPCFTAGAEEDAKHDQRRLAEASLKRKIIAFFQGVERDIPDISRQDLTQLMEYIRPPGMLAGATNPQPLPAHQ